MFYIALEIIGWLALVFALGLLLMWLLMRGSAVVSSHDWETAQKQLTQAELDRSSFNNQQLRLTADLDARTSQVGDLEAALRSLEVQTGSAALDVHAANSVAADVSGGAASGNSASVRANAPAPSGIVLPRLAELQVDASFVTGDADMGTTPASKSAAVEDLLALLAATQQEAARVSDLEARIEDLTTVGAGASAGVSVSSARIIELESEVGQLRGRVDQTIVVEGRLADLEVEAGRVAGLEAQLEALRAERYAQLEEESPVGESGESLAELERELETARTESATELKALQQRVDDLHADAERVHEVEARLIEVDTEARRMTAEIERSQSAISVAETRSSAFEAQIMLLQNERDQGPEASIDSPLQRAEFERRANEAEAEAKVAQSRVTELVAQLVEAQSQTSALETQVPKPSGSQKPSGSPKRRTLQQQPKKCRHSKSSLDYCALSTSQPLSGHKKPSRHWRQVMPNLTQHMCWTLTVSTM